MGCIYGPGPRISYSSYASLTVCSKITNNNISIMTSYIFTTVFIATSGLHKRKMGASNHMKDDVTFVERCTKGKILDICILFRVYSIFNFPFLTNLK